MKKYFDQLHTRLETLEISILFRVQKVLNDALESGKNVFIAGNGGSAATAQHFATDLSKDIINSRGEGIKVYCLSTNSSIITAFGNDLSFDFIFAKQIENYANNEDVLIVLTCSGESSNIINSLKVARSRNMHTIAFTGTTGGLIVQEELAEIIVHVPEQHYGIVEDVHHAACHAIAFSLKTN